MKAKLITSIISYILIAIGVVSSLMIIGGPNVTAGKDVLEKFRESMEMSLAINYMIFIVIAGIALVILFFIYQLATQPKKTLISILGLILAAVIYFIFLTAGTSDTTDTLALKNPVSIDVVRHTTAGLYTIGVSLIVGLLVIVAGPLMGRYRK